MHNHRLDEHDVFLDKTALTAFMDPEDSRYVKASSFFLDLDDLERNFVTTNYIIFDIHKWLKNEYGYTHAEFFLNTIDKAVGSGKLTVIPGNSDLEDESKKLLMQRPEYQFSLDEAVTAVAMLSYQIKRIFTFNPNFLALTDLDSEIKVIPSLTF